MTTVIISSKEIHDGPTTISCEFDLVGEFTGFNLTPPAQCSKGQGRKYKHKGKVHRFTVDEAPGKVLNHLLSMGFHYQPCAAAAAGDFNVKNYFWTMMRFAAANVSYPILHHPPPEAPPPPFSYTKGPHPH